MLHRPPDQVRRGGPTPVAGSKDGARRVLAAVDVLSRSAPSRDVGGDRVDTVLPLALVVVDADDDVPSLVTLGVEPVVARDPAGDRVVVLVDLGHLGTVAPVDLRQHPVLRVGAGRDAPWTVLNPRRWRTVHAVRTRTARGGEATRIPSATCTASTSRSRRPTWTRSSPTPPTGSASTRCRSTARWTSGAGRGGRGHDHPRRPRGGRALDVFADVLAPACISTDHPRYLSFIPCAPTEAAAFDLVVGASSIYGGLVARGRRRRVRREPGAALDRRPGRPAAGGRRRLRARRHHRQPVRAGRRPAYRPARRGSRGRLGRRPWRVAATTARTPRSSRPATSWTPSSSASTVDDHWRLTGDNLRDGTLEDNGPETFFAVVATPGRPTSASSTTSRRWPRSAREFGIWFHVDGAYGGAGARRALGAAALRRRRARRLVHRRPAQVAVRAVRLLRPALPRPGPGPGGAHPARRLPRRAHRRPPTGTRPTTPSA